LDPVESRAERIERLFHVVLAIGPDSREAYLDHACGGDEPLRIALGKLLDANARVERKPSWDEPAIQNEAAHISLVASDASLDRYRLIELIGAGGMGTVYKAIRADDEFSKLVAIKIMQIGSGGDRHDGEHAETIRRFRQERQILAGLDHPNIARLLDGGSTADGLPFLVMDYVDGVRIDRYLSVRKPPRREVLELFRAVCSAVSHAHQKLVVHRDLKPANILVTADGVPKLLDFGVAKLLDGSAERTKTGAGAMTPEYASPEQIRGGIVTTTADVYSLGALLYEMLSGVRPYHATTNAMELAQAICTETPQPMSAWSAGSFDGDLENIVQMALRKEPERRYASVEQFSEDLRRHMEGYPVAARPATSAYRARKFAGRNKVSIAAAALIVLALLAGIAATAWEARLANQRFNDVRGLASAYLFEFHDAIKDLPGSTPARQLVVKRGIEYLDKLANERGGDTSLQRELARAYGKVGDVQGTPNFPSLGDRAGALATHRKALAILEPLAAADPRNTEIGVELSNSYWRIGELLQYAGDVKGSAAIDRRSVQFMEKLAAARPASRPVREALALAYSNLGSVTGNNEMPNLGDARGALEFFQKARDIREKLVAETPGGRESRMLLSEIYARIGSLQQALDDKEQSVKAFREAIALDEQLSREDPFSVMYRRQSAVENRSLALVLIRTGNLPEAQKCGDRSAQLFEQLAKEDPANLEAQEALADSYYSQGYLRARANDPANALRYYDSAVTAYDAVMAKHPGSLPGGLRTVYQLMADLGIKTGDTDRALRCTQKELEIDGKLLAADPNEAGAQRNRGVAFTQIGQAHEGIAMRKTTSLDQQISQLHEARKWYLHGLDVWTDLRTKGMLIPMYAPKLAEATSNVARCDRALSTMHQ
jgi:eukaryotic-like serine/threonine-protein kinase